VVLFPVTALTLLRSAEQGQATSSRRRDESSRR
jgi:hypothetical protein